jgi:hypothetical protein
MPCIPGRRAATGRAELGGRKQHHIVIWPCHSLAGLMEFDACGI